MFMEQRNSADFLMFWVCGIAQSGAFMQTTISFIILIRAIYTRYAALNEFFRYCINVFRLYETFSHVLKYDS